MQIRTVETTPFDDQKPGTAGLRKAVKQFRTPAYLENFVQAVFDTVPAIEGNRLVLGGDGRYFNREAADTVIRMAVANGVSEIIVGAGVLLSTPAAAHLIARESAAGGFLLTASHNPGGPDGDFGIKFNVEGGGQASADLTERIFDRTRQIRQYRIADTALPSLDTPDEHRVGDTRLRIVDPVQAHADLLESQFDFDAIRDWLAERPGRFRFDAMHAVTGPYAREIFVNRLGLSDDGILNAVPREDFGGRHPDPNPVDAADFVRLFEGPDAPELGGASDGDGDRNMIVGPDRVVSPCDSLAVIAANHEAIPAFRDGLPGVARSMPTSRAVDAVADALGIPCYETPTGWRFFAGLLETGRIRLCGEESFGTSSDHVREKDGLWAVLAWLQILASRGLSVNGILKEHWQRFGRHYFVRHDYQLDADQGDQVMRQLEGLATEGGLAFEGEHLTMDQFDYTDPVTGHTVTNQGIRLYTPTGGRAVFRLSGTGTHGATLRIYLEQYVSTDTDQPRNPILQPLADMAVAVSGLASVRQAPEPDTVI